MTTPQCRKHPGFYSLAGYYHAKQLRNGKYSLYEGSWVNSGCSVGYLEVVRDYDDHKPMRFVTLEAASRYARGERTP